MGVSAFYFMGVSAFPAFPLSFSSTWVSQLFFSFSPQLFINMGVSAFCQLFQLFLSFSVFFPLFQPIFRMLRLHFEQLMLTLFNQLRLSAQGMV
jgi:hypothetical protein